MNDKVSGGSLDAVTKVYAAMIEAWNTRQADAFAALFSSNGSAVGFDGSQLIGRRSIAESLTNIFSNHQTGRYVTVVQEVRRLAPDVALLCGAVGMVPFGQTDLNPSLNAIQNLVVVRHRGSWEIALLQNTPAQFHGRPDLFAELTGELRRVLSAGQ
jgi:uncharacterized protein (TIGR02246 family)